MSITIESVEQYKELLSSNAMVLVDYHAKWCKPCIQLAPYIEQIAQKYPNLKVLKVDYDVLDEIIDAEGIEKLPSIKTFHNGKVIKVTIGASLPIIDDQLDELLKLGGTAADPQQQHQQPQQQQQQQALTPVESTKSPPQAVQRPQFAHPADAAAGMKNVPTGSNKMLNLKPVPPQLTQFQSTLATYSVVLFTHESQVGVTGSTGASYGKQVNIVNQTVQDLKLLVDQYTASKQPVMFKHVVISENDPTSKILAEEYGATELHQLPIIKLIFKKICYATFIKGDTLEVEKALLDFVQL